MPKMSVMKPGVSSSTPPKITRTPSITSRCGTRASASAALKRCQASRPWERSSHEPSSASAISSSTVHQTPIAWPTWIRSASSAIGTMMKRRTSRMGICALPTVLT